MGGNFNFAVAANSATDVSLAAAATSDIGSLDSNRVHLTATGAVTVTSFGTAPEQQRLVFFDAGITLQHGAALITLTSGDRLTTEGNFGFYESDASGIWREVFFSSAQTGGNTFFLIASAPHQGWWFLDNASWDGTHFYWVDNTKPAIAINSRAEYNLPFESGTTGLMFLRAYPPGGTSQISDSYGAAGGWETLFIMTEFKDLVVGGFGIEVDGNGAPFYGRFVNTDFSGHTFVGFLQNFFNDFSGVDNIAAPSWIVGVLGDEFVIGRSAAGDTTGASLVKLVTVDNTGLVTAANGFSP